MTFLHPEFLYLMLPPALALFFFLLTQQEHIADFFSEEVMARLRVQTNRMTLRARNALFLVMTILLIMTLAQPVIEEGKVKVQAKSADVMIALDISDSMLAEDVYPSRLKQAKQKILELLAMAPQERMGVMAFAKETYLVAPLSFDHRAVSFLVKQLQPSHLTEKGTDIKQLLQSAGEMMKEKEHKYLLVMSDGGDQEAFDEEIILAKKLGITVFVLGLGTEKGAPIKSKEGGFIKQRGAIIISRLNTGIAGLATETGGSYIGSVTGNEDMTAMLSEIAVKTTKRTLAEEEITQYIQLFYYPLGLAMILLLFATSSMSKRRRMEVPSAFIALWLLLSGTPSEAGLMDFTLLEDAKKAYEKEEYLESSALYKKYIQSNPSNQAYYNYGNSLYKTGAYKKAANAYEKVNSSDENILASALFNAGNSYYQLRGEDNLKEAITAYEKSLELIEDEKTRQNLEKAKKELEKEQKKKQQQDQGDQQGKEQEPGEDGKPDSSDKQQKSDQQGSPDDQKGEKSKADQKKQQEGKQDAEKEQSEQSEADETPKQQKSGKPEDQKKEDGETGKVDAVDEAGMSDLEAAKWLKILNDHPASHIYRLGPMNTEKESTDAKPW